jgi:hypothetical protein
VGVHDGLAIVLDDISNQREQLHLLAPVDRGPICLGRRIEPSELTEASAAIALKLPPARFCSS